MGIDWQSTPEILGYTLVVLLCIGGFLLSCLSLSGTWLVLAAAGLAAWINWPDFPGIGTLITFLLLCIGVEIAEAVAGAWGVQKRGGSKTAGWAAIGGGLLGMVLGTFIPIPIFGNLIGMMLGSFGCAFLVEHAKMKKATHAAHVATGAVLARVGVIFIKVGVTVIMTFVLVLGLAIS
ncbi:MAG: DUF456 domain-containing protein [Pontiella sp.]|nr:DUF456 domain-containing protein [Pontiella sp.]